jgi:hypothetical protein
MPNKYFFAAAFAHRHNLDGSWDSICTKCFLTIATERSEDRLLMHEHCHDCDSLIKARVTTAGFPEPLRGAGAMLNKRRASAYVRTEDEPN